MVQDNPYNPYGTYDGSSDVRFYTKSGILGSWKARALQYITEKVCTNLYFVYIRACFKCLSDLVNYSDKYSHQVVMVGYNETVQLSLKHNMWPVIAIAENITCLLKGGGGGSSLIQ